MKNRYFSISNLIRLISVTLLFYATTQHAYSYYIFLRWFVFASSIFFAYESNKNDKKLWLISFSVLALIFNPIVPIYLKKEIWTFIDLFSGIFVFVSIFFNELKEGK